jgi:Uma2 family endonuclease
MSALPTLKLTPEEYLEFERKSDVKHEYHRGFVYAMAGASFRHGIIVANLSRDFGVALRGGPCLFVTQDVRVQTSSGPVRSYTYPDLVAFCGEPILTDNAQDTLSNPKLIVEVLSPSTEAHDRGLKFAEYRTIPTLEEYVLVSQTELRVERFHRQPDGQWLYTDFTGPEGVCRFESLDLTLRLADIYENVSFA